MEQEMNIEQAQYYQIEGRHTSIGATIDGVEVSVPLAEGNRHYDELMRQVNAGTLTIEEAQ